MRIGLLTDTHWTARKSSRHMHDYFELFYKNIFFPTLENEGITTVVHMGDAFDNRKSIDFWGLDWTRKVVLDPLSKYETHMIIGNHDIFLRNSTEINSPELLLKDYTNIKIYSSPQTTKIGGLDIMIIPWICSENYDETLIQIKKSKAKIAMGHLELNGFSVYPGHIYTEGLDKQIFKKFDKVFSGHYHTRSNDGKIFYLGNPYQMFWNDVNDKRGFHIFDTNDYKLKCFDNPYTMFEKVYYNDENEKFDISSLENKMVKVIVQKKENHLKFDKFIDNIQNANPLELKIIENTDFYDEEVNCDDIPTEDTISILDKYVEESEFNLNKDVVKKLLREVYKQALEIE